MENKIKTLYGFPSRGTDKRKFKGEGVESNSNPNGRSVDIKSFWSRQHEIINLDSLGFKGAEIAKLLNISPVTVSNTLNSTIGKELKSDLRLSRDEEYEEMREDIIELTKKSIKVYHELFDEPEGGEVSLKMKKEAADTVLLELSGLRAPTRVDTRSLNFQVTREEVEEFKKRGIEAARANGKIVDVKVRRKS